MGRIETLSLLFIAGFLVSGPLVDAQTTDNEDIWASWTTTIATTTEASVVLTPSSCKSFSGKVADLCIYVSGTIDLNQFLADNLPDACAYSLFQYACADVGAANPNTIASIWKCHITNPEAVLSQEAMSLLVSKLPLETLKDTLNIINAQVPASTITPRAKEVILNSVWERLRTNSSGLSPGLLASWFQERLYPFLSAINIDILDCMIQLPLTCDGFEVVVTALDAIYVNFINTTRQDIGNWISRFIRVNSCRKSSVSEWIISYFRQFKNDVNYKDYKTAWNDIDLSLALDEVTSFQVADYAINSNAFSSVQSLSAIIEFLNKKNIFYIVDFLDSLSQLSGSSSVSYQQDVLFSLLKITLLKLNNTNGLDCKPRLDEIFQIKVTFILRAINESALQLIPNVNCSDFFNIFKGVDLVINDLSEENQLAVSKFRQEFLKKKALKAESGCTNGSSSKDWLQDTFGPTFKFLTYSEILSLNPSFNGFEALDVLTLNQTLDVLLQSNFLANTESSPELESQMSAIVDTLKIKGFAYLQECVEVAKNAIFQTNIPSIPNPKIRCLMLDALWELLVNEYSQFTLNEWYKWFNEYMPLLLPCIKEQQLDDLSVGVVKNCSNFQAIVRGLDVGFDYMSVETKEDIASWLTDFLRAKRCNSSDWLDVNFKRFKEFISISTIKELNEEFDMFEALDVLTLNQTLEVIKNSNILTNVESSPEVDSQISAIANLFSIKGFAYLQENAEDIKDFLDQSNITSIPNPKVRCSLLDSVWELLVKEFPQFTLNEWSKWFNDYLPLLLPCIKEQQLDDLSVGVVKNCSNFQAIVRGLDVGFDYMSEETKEDIALWLTDFLRAKRCNSSDWLDVNFKRFKEFISISTIKELNEEFDMFAALDVLTLNQTLDVIKNSNILTNVESSPEVDSQISAIANLFSIKGFAYLQENAEDIKEFLDQSNITSIPNPKVRCSLLDSVWELLVKEFPQFTLNEWSKWFNDYLPLLLPCIKEQQLDDLSVGVVKNCSNFQAIVRGLDVGFDYMSEETKEDIALWLTDFLRAKRCNSSDWLDVNFKRFKEFISISTIKELNEEFDMFAALDVLTLNQTLDVIKNSNILTNVESSPEVDSQISAIANLFSIKGFAYLQENAEDIKEFLDQSNITSIPNPKVRCSLLDSVWELLVKEFPQFTLNEWSKWFNDYLPLLLPCIKEQQLDDLSVGVVKNCSNFQAIVRGLDVGFDYMSEETKEDIALWLTDFLRAKRCNSSDWLDVNFKRFKEFISISTIKELNEEFDMFAALDVLTLNQTLDVIKNSNILTNVESSPEVDSQISAIANLFSIKGFAYLQENAEDIKEFLDQSNITSIPNPKVRCSLLDSVWELLVKEFPQFTLNEWSKWFNDYLPLLLPCIKEQQLDDLSVGVVKNCSNFQAIVRGLDVGFDYMSEETKEDIASWLTDFLRAKRCNSSDWLDVNFKRFKEFISISTIKELNEEFDMFAALDVLTLYQTLDVIKNSNILTNVESSPEVDSQISAIANLFSIKGFAYLQENAEDIKEFLDQSNITSIPNPKVRCSLLDSVWELLVKEFPQFTLNEWSKWFNDYLPLLLPCIKEQQLDDLSVGVVKNCSNFQAIVRGLDVGFDYMSEETKEDIASWLTDFLRAKRCNSSDWLDVNFKRFKEFISISTIKELNEEFDMFAALDVLTLNQTLDVIKNSNILTNVESSPEVDSQISAIANLFSIKGFAYLQENAEDIKEFLDQSNITSIPNPKVRCSLLDSVWELLVKEFPQFTLNEWSKWFNDYLPLLLPCIKEQQLDDLSVGVVKNCSNFQAIVRGLDVGFDYMSEETKEDIALWLTDFLRAKRCNSSDWLDVNFKRFKEFISISTIKELNEEFDMFEALDVLTLNQTLDVIKNSNILTNVESSPEVDSQISAIANLFSIKGFAYLQENAEDIKEFLDQSNITSIPNAKVRCSLLDSVWELLVKEFPQFTLNEWSKWFNDYLPLLLPCIKEQQLDDLSVGVVKNCSNFQAIVRGLDVGFDYMSEETKEDIALWLTDFLRAKRCNSSDWLDVNFKRFKEFISISTIKELNEEFDMFAALDVLTLNQTLDVIKNSNILTNVESSPEVDSQISAIANLFSIKGFAYLQENAEDIKEFLDQSNITSIPNPKVRCSLLDSVWELLVKEFPQFTLNEWSKWFNDYLPLLLPCIKEQQLDDLSVGVVKNCSNFQAIVRGLDVGFDYMSEETKEDIALWLTDFLRAKRCNSSDWLNVNFKRFKEFISISTIKELNEEFDMFAALDVLTLNQTLDVIKNSNILTNVESSPEVDSQISAIANLFSIKGFAYLQENAEDIKEFLDQSNITSIPNPKVRCSLLDSVWELLVKEFPQFTLNEWSKWFNDYLPLLLPCIKEQQLDDLSVGVVKNCSNFQAIVRGLDVGFDYMSEETKEDIASWLTDFLRAKRCNSSDWLDVNFKRFKEFISISTIKELNEEFDMFAALDVLTLNQTLDVIKNSNILTNVESSPEVDSQISAIANLFSIKGFAYLQENAEDIKEFLDQSNITSIPNPKVRCSLLDSVWELLVKEFPQFTLNEWSKWFNDYLPLLLPCIKEQQLDDLSVGVVKNCSNFQAIVRGLDVGFDYMSEETKEDIASWLTDFLRAKRCNSSDWLDVNFKRFKEFISISTIKELNEEFDMFAALDVLTLNQTLDVIKNSNILTNVESSPEVDSQISAIANLFSIKGFAYLQENAEDIKEFLDQSNITSIPNPKVRCSLLDSVWELLVKEFPQFTLNEWSKWFNDYLPLLLPCIKEQQLDDLSVGVVKNCSNFQAIVRGLDVGFDYMSEETKEDIALWLTDFLRAKRCNSSDWLDVNFKRFKEFISISTIKELNEEFDMFAALDVLTLNQTLDVIKNSNILTNVESSPEVDSQISAIANLFSIKGFAYLQENAEDIKEFLDQSNITSIPNPKVRCSLLDSVWELLVKEFPQFTLNEWSKWFNDYLPLLLPCIKEQQLDDLSVGVVKNCSNFQAIVRGLDVGFDYMSEETKEDIAFWLTDFLRAKRCNSSDWLDVNFKRFKEFISISTIKELNEEFDMFAALDVLTLNQTLDVIKNSNILTNVESSPEVDSQISAIANLFSIKGFAYLQENAEDIKEFLDQSNITSIPNPKVRCSLLDSVWELLVKEFPQFTLNEWSKWFNDYLPLLLPCIKEQQLDDLSVGVVKNCSNFQAIVRGLDVGFDYMSEETKEDIAFWLTDFLRAKRCNSSDWLDVNFKRFKEFISISTIKELNEEFDMFAALDVLTLNQTLDVIKNSNILTNVESSPEVDSQISAIANLFSIKGFAYLQENAEDIKEFLDQSNITSIPNPKVRCSLLDSVWELLVKEFPQFTLNEWSKWFNDYLPLLLPCIKEQQLDDLSVGVVKNCSNFQAIVRGLDVGFDYMSEETKEDIALWLTDFLRAKRCNSSDWLDVNFKRFKEFISISTIKELNEEFDMFAALDVLTLNQTLDVIKNSNILTNVESSPEVDSQISAIANLFSIKGFAYLQENAEDIKEFLDQSNITSIPNPKVRCSLLDSVWELLVKEFPQFTLNEWSKWFNDYLPLLLPCIKEQQLDDLSVGVVKNCSNFQAIVRGLDVGFDYMSEETKEDIALWLTDFLRAKRCNSSDWLDVNFKRFKEFISISTIKELNEEFDMFEALDVLTLNQTLDVIKNSNILTNVESSPEVDSQISAIANLFSIKGFAYLQENAEDIKEFLDQSNITSIPNPKVRCSLLDSVWELLVKEFPQFTLNEWSKWFNDYLPLLLPCIKEQQLDDLSVGVVKNCSNFQAIVRGLDVGFDYMSEETKEDIALWLTDFLRAKRCNSSDWLDVNFKRFKEFISISTIKELNEEFDMFAALDVLTLKQTLDVIKNSNILTNVESSPEVDSQISAIANLFSIKGFAYLQENAEDIKEFLDQSNITSIPNPKVRCSLLDSVWELLVKEFPQFTLNEWSKWFNDYLPLLLPCIKEQQLDDLSVGVVKNCSNFQAIVRGLDVGFDYMSEETKEDIALWLTDFLRAKRCNSSDWLDVNFKRFKKFISISTIKELNEEFDMFEALDVLTLNQTLDVIKNSNILTNVESSPEVDSQISAIANLFSIKGFAYLQENAEDIKEFLDQSNITSIPNPKVRCSLLDSVWELLVKEFPQFTLNQWSKWFNDYLPLLLPCIKEQQLDDLSVGVVKNCSNFQAIVRGLDVAFDYMSEETKAEIALWLTDFLRAKRQDCSALYTDSRTYLTTIYFRFVSYVTFYELNAFYNKFNAYEVLDIFSGRQLGNLLINSSAIQEEKKAVQILVELDKRGVMEVNECMVEVTRVVEEKNIIRLPDVHIESLILDTVLAKIPKEDYLASFDAELKILLPSLSVTVIEDLPTNADCDSQTSAVRAFGDVFDIFSEEQRVAVHKFILNSLTQKKKAQGDSCNSDKSSGEWIVVNYGPYKKYATLKDYEELKANFSAVSALSECTGTQIADFVIAYGGLNSVETITTAFKSLQSTEEVLGFYEQLNEVAESELRASLHVQLILEYTFEIISADFIDYQEEQWTEWFQVTLQNVLFAVNATQLERIPLPLPCSSFQQIVKGFDNVFDLMNEQTRQAVYETLIKRQFESLPVTDVICGEKSERTQEWIDINFASFWQYALFTDILKWNKGFVVTDVISTLSVEQLAEVALQPANINNEELACQIVGKLQEVQISDVYQFLDHFNSYSIQINISDLPNEVIRLKFLSASIDLIEENLPTYSAGDWETLLSVRLRSFLKSINSELLDLLLKHLKVNDYPILIKHLNELYDSLSSDVRESLYGSLSGYLISAFETIDSPVSVGGEDTDEWVLGLLGKFSVYAQYSDFVKIRPNFHGLHVISSLSAEQVGELVFSGDILSNQSSADIVVNTLDRWTFNQIDYFLSSFQANAEQKGILSLANVNIRSSLLNVIYSKLSVNFHSFTLTQWREFFSVKLSFFLGSITESQINLIPSNIDCDVFQIIVSALDSHFQDLSNGSRQAFYNKSKAYLLAKKQGSVSACSEKTSGSIAWLQTNLGSFRALASYQDIISLKPDFIFTDAVSILNENQLASYCVESDALIYTDKIAKVFTGVRNLDLGAFLDAFNLAAEQNHLTQLPNSEVRKFFIGEVFCQLGSRFSLFTPAEYTNWLSVRLKLFVSDLNAKTLGFIPTDISCNSLAAIIGTLSNAQNTEYPEDIYNFLKSVLATKLENSGSACTSAGLSDREWLLKYFGKYSTFAKWSDIIALNPTFQVLKTVDLLTDIQLASAIVSTTIISNVTAINEIFVSISDDTDFLFNFLGSLEDFVLKDTSLLANIKVRDAILMHTAEIVFPKFNGYPLTNLESWMTKIGFLLPGINATMLNFISLDVPCTYYKAIIQGLDKIFPALTLTKRLNVANFAKKYLAHQKEVNDNICLSTPDDIIQWINNNLGRFCRVIPVSDIKAFYPEVDTENYERVCDFS